MLCVLPASGTGHVSQSLGATHRRHACLAGPLRCRSCGACKVLGMWRCPAPHVPPHAPPVAARRAIEGESALRRAVRVGVRRGTWRGFKWRGSDAASRLASDPLAAPVTVASVHAVQIEQHSHVQRVAGHIRIQTASQDSNAHQNEWCRKSRSRTLTDDPCALPADGRRHDGQIDGAVPGDGSGFAGARVSPPPHTSHHSTPPITVGERLSSRPAPQVRLSPCACRRCTSRAPIRCCYAARARSGRGRVSGWSRAAFGHAV